MKRTFAFLLLGALTFIAFGATVFLLSRNLGKGALQVTSEPNSKVYLDGKLIGTTPLCKCDANTTIPEGTYTIRLVGEGNLPPFEQKIAISAKVLTVVDRTFVDGSGSSGSVITLSKLPDKNSLALMVTSFPDGAKIFLDSSFIGDSPYLLNDIAESDHELKLSKTGYKDKILKIRTSKGYKLEAQVYLAANPQEVQVSTPSASIAPSKTTVTILQTPTGFLRVRDSASLGGNQVGQVLPGETYDLLDEQNGWYKIKLKDATVGWVSSQYAQKQP